MDFNERMVHAVEKRLTFIDAKKELKNLGMWLSVRDSEYRVAFPYDEASAYYTNDLEDALHTGRQMAATRRK